MKRNNASNASPASGSLTSSSVTNGGVSTTTTATSTTTSNGPPIITLNRRRGTKGTKPKSKLSSTWYFPLILLGIIATVLTIGIGILFYAYLLPNSTTGQRIQNSNIIKKLPGNIPNLLRGRHFDTVKKIVVDNNESTNVVVEKDDNHKEVVVQEQQQEQQQQQQQEQRKVELTTTTEHKVYKESTSNIDTSLYDTIPTELYPYSLEPVKDGYTIATDYTVKSGSRYSEYTTGGTPYIVSTDNILQQSNSQARSRRSYIKSTMEFVWSNYVQHAFGQDELLPRTGGGSNGWGGHGVTLVDSLDTLWIMNMTTEFYQARDWVRDNLHHNTINSPVSVFETTIRDLGGLLSAYDWSNDTIFLNKAIDLGERLLKAFDDNQLNGLPYGQIVLGDNGGHGSNLGWAGNNAVLADFGTIQIEFNYLAQASGRPELASKPNKVFELMYELHPPHGLYPNFFHNIGEKGSIPQPTNDKLTFGAMADSFYEYMLKLWLQSDKTNTMYLTMYNTAIDGMHDQLLQKSIPSGLTYIADRNNGQLDTKMDHLVCFMGGLLALGAYTNPDGLQSPRAQRDLRTGKALTYTCYQMYARMSTGVSADYVQFGGGGDDNNNDFHIPYDAPHYLLRPEVVESFFILNYLTNDPIYREWGWEIYQNIEKNCKTTYGYGGLDNVQHANSTPRNKMESFFLAETLKYLYLLQDPDTQVDILNTHVFNTEAHPLRKFSKMNKKQSTGTTVQ